MAVTRELAGLLPHGAVLLPWDGPVAGDYLYLHCRPNGVPFYVGKGRGARAASFTKSRNKHHRDVVGHYGPESILILFALAPDEATAFAWEIEAIRKLRAAEVALANYNEGGEGSTNPSLEARAKMAAAKAGRQLSEEHRAKISAAHMGKQKTAKHLAAIGAALKGKRPSEAATLRSADLRRGVKQCPEAVEKRVAPLRGRKRPAEFRQLMSEVAKARIARGVPMPRRTP